MSYSVGECKYCGQLVQVDEPYDTMEEAKEAAFAFCDCAGARAERRTLDQINNATEKIREIFGKVGEKAGFQTSTDQNVLEILFEAACAAMHEGLREARAGMCGRMQKMGGV